MQATDHNSQAYQAPEFPDVCVASGWGAKISTQYNQLIVEDGSGSRRRIRQYSRATVPFGRIVVTAATGYISLSAIRWCRDSGVAVYQIGRDGQLLSVSGDLGADRPQLRRAQAKALGSPVGLTIARQLVRRKLQGQAAVAAALPSPVRIRVPGLSAPRVKTPTDLLAIEAEIAASYWQACDQLTVQFAARDLSRIPAHWTRLGTRRSPISGTHRTAASPAGAMLNFSYAVLAAEGRLACLATGLDPGLGLYHVDKQGRDSLVYDIIEPIRPIVDAWLYDLLQNHVFSRDDFLETRAGAVRVNPPLSDHLAATGPLWAEQITDQLQRLVAVLLPAEDAAPEGTSTRGPIEATRTRARRPRPRCRNCGEQIGVRSKYCELCRPEALVVAGQRSAARRLETGIAGSTLRKKSQAMKQRQKANANWNLHQDRPDPERYRTQILPHLTGIPLNEIARATGLSKSYCSLIRRGEVVPHPSHWDSLLAIGKRNP